MIYPAFQIDLVWQKAARTHAIYVVDEAASTRTDVAPTLVHTVYSQRIHTILGQSLMSTGIFLVWDAF